MRTSSRRYNINIETGRHDDARQNNILDRLCYQCSEEETVNTRVKLPFFDPINEDDCHVLHTCPTYEDIREPLSGKARAYFLGDLPTFFTDKTMILEAAKMIVWMDKNGSQRKGMNSTVPQSRRIKLHQCFRHDQCDFS